MKPKPSVVSNAWSAAIVAALMRLAPINEATMLTDRQRQALHAERTFRASTEEHDEFIDHINKRANLFRMTGTGCATVDDKRLRNWNNPPKTVNLRERGVGYYGGCYREIEYEHTGPCVRLICTHLQEIEDIPIGTKMARVDGNRLIVTKFNGSKPSEIVDTYIIKDEQPKAPIIKKICARCNKECGDDGMYCSQKCRRKQEKKLFGTMKRSPSPDKTFLRNNKDESLKYVLMVKETVERDRG